LRPRLRLAIVGDGTLRPEITRRLAQAGLENQAWIPGALEDIPAVLQSFDVFVLPSLNEGISNTILEAMASGLPVVATRVGGNPELIENGETGWLTEPQSVDDMMAAMRRYAESADLRAAHGQAGRARVESRFSLAAMVSAYTRTYDELLPGR
jgi:glycosyltransferase involved in cell wall biosynthesis